MWKPDVELIEETRTFEDVVWYLLLYNEEILVSILIGRDENG